MSKPSGLVPPAWAISGRPPPLPPTYEAISRTRSPALTFDTRSLETAAINTKIAPLHLQVKEVAADGNCLFRAIAQQLALSDPLMNSPTAYRILRRKAAYYLREHEDDFKFFLEDNVNYQSFCDTVEFSNGIVEIFE